MRSIRWNRMDHLLDRLSQRDTERIAAGSGTRIDPIDPVDDLPTPVLDVLNGGRRAAGRIRRTRYVESDQCLGRRPFLESTGVIHEQLARLSGGQSWNEESAHDFAFKNPVVLWRSAQTRPGSSRISSTAPRRGCPKKISHREPMTAPALPSWYSTPRSSRS